MPSPLRHLLVVAALPLFAFAADQPQWGQKLSRNMVSAETNLVDSFDPATGRNVKWKAALGNQSYATPIVAGGKVLIGTNNDVPRDPKHTMDAGVLMCFNAADGALAWQLVSPKLEGDRYYDWPHTGWQSPPSVEGDNVYVVSNRGEVMCLDLQGLANGNDGPYRDEGKHMSPRQLGDEPLSSTDGDIRWLFDMVKDAGIWPHDAAHSSILIDGPFLYVNTGNGVDNTHKKIRKPDAPSLIVLEKSTGRLIATDDEHIGDHIFHATWSSPSIGEVNGRRLVFFGGGDGVLYAFEALKDVPPPGAVRKLKKVFSFDCDPDAPKKGDIHQYLTNRRVSPSNILGMPVVADGRVYVAAGGDLWWGKRQSWLKCVDPTKEGDVTKSAQVWSYPMPSHCIGTPAVKDGLVFIADAARTLHCINASDGQPVWTHKAGGEFWSSPLVADGKVYIGSRKGDFLILSASREKKILCDVDLGAPIAGTATAANGTLYIATMQDLWAIGK
ncbi:MAG TPA: PQQ-binding-like beta-propeller repeat protein [Tepidisphaeraceae bacterium]